jgi:hypothetical protein
VKLSARLHSFGQLIQDRLGRFKVDASIGDGHAVLETSFAFGGHFLIS